MNKIDLVELALRNLLRRKTRTLLAVVGVVVGVCAIVVMLAIGFGLSESFKAQIDSAGNLHLVNVYSGGGMAMSPDGDGKPVVLNDKAVAQIEKIPGVDAASPKESLNGTAAMGKYICQVQLVGLRPEVMQKFQYGLEEGRALKPGDKFTAVFGKQVPPSFYDPRRGMTFNTDGKPVVDVMTDKMIVTADENYGQKRSPGTENEEKINYKEYKLKGVGILENANDESSYTVFMPLAAVKTMKDDAAKARKEAVQSAARGYDEVMVYVGDINEVETVSEAIRVLGFQPNSLNDWLQSMQDTAKMIQGILGGIGAISLFVAALGITNTMIMSIYERTKEIGVMKVIGANLPDIRRLFLLEAGMIGFVGGTAGLLFSYFIAFLMNTVLSDVIGGMLGSVGGTGGSTIAVIPWWVAAGALAFSTVIGVISGYYPARRAMNLSALESLKNE